MPTAVAPAAPATVVPEVVEAATAVPLLEATGRAELGGRYAPGGATLPVPSEPPDGTRP